MMQENIMIGDWYTIIDPIQRIQARVTAIGGEITCKSMGGETVHVSETDLYPIAYTDEILIKNGWRQEGDQYMLPWGSCNLVIKDHKFEIRSIKGIHFRFSGLLFVHDIQHILNINNIFLSITL